MREIVVISGKGGTGKTTVASSFALLPGEKVVVDADVDAPDLFIVLKPKVLEAYSFKGRKVARILQDVCERCGECRKLCRFDAIDENYQVSEIMCEGCALCYFACPCGAVVLEEKESGMWFVAESRAGIMLHAKLHPGEENSGKLITQLRRRAKDIAEERGVEVVLIDGPPGIGCPTISSITGATDVVLVAEPTCSGIHDLKRVVELCKSFNLKMWLVVNRFDVNVDLTEQIEEWAKGDGVRVLGRIPFDKSIPVLQMEGKAPVEGDSFSGEVIRDCWDKLLKEV